MASRRLKVESVSVENLQSGKSMVVIQFSRHLTQLEVSGVRAVLEGEIK